MLQLVREGKARTRRDLIAVTGLARSTVTQRVDQLIEAGYLEESGVGTSTGGRPPSVLSPRSSAGVVLVADIGATHCRVALTDLAANSLVEDTVKVRIEQGPETVLSWLRDTFLALLERTGRKEDLCGIGLGLPGPVEFASGKVVQPPIMPGWHDYPVREYLRATFDVPILVDNDAKVLALGEWATGWRDSSSFVLVKVGTGIGCGIVIGGKVYRGIDSAAGDIGHVRLSEHHDDVCACGARGCVASVASGAALARRLREQGKETRDSHDVVRLVQAGDTEAVTLTRESGQLLGEVLATVVSLLNPGVLMLAGNMAETHEHFLTGIREVVYRSSLPLATRNLEIVTSRLKERAGVVGAATMVVDYLLSAEVVDARLS